MPEEQPTHVIYAGKTSQIDLGTQIVILTQGTIYKLPFPPHIQAAIEAKPTLKGFFTTPDKFLHHTRLMGVKVGATTLPKGRYLKRKGAK
jgi:hypothetical protein